MKALDNLLLLHEEKNMNLVTLHWLTMAILQKYMSPLLELIYADTTVWLRFVAAKLSSYFPLLNYFYKYTNPFGLSQN